MDLSTLTDEELADHLNAVLAEQERRQALATIPDQIRELTAKYVDAGGSADYPDGSTLNAKFIAGPGDIHLSAAGYARYIKDLPAMS